MARKLYVYAPERQDASVRPFTRTNKKKLEVYGNAHAEQILADKARARAEHKRWFGDKLQHARGQLRSNFIASRNRATLGPKVRREFLRMRRLGTPSTHQKIKKHFTDLHAVKFGHDPFHK